MKKFLSLLLSLCLMTSLATQAFAAGESGSTDVTFTSDVMAPDVLNVVIPAEIPIHMSAAGDIQVASTLAIENKSSKAVEIQAVRVEGKNGWAILDYNSDFSDKPTGTKDLALSFRGDGTGSDGQIALTAGNWRVETGSSLPINADAKLPMQTETAKTSIATVYWTLDFADDSGSENPDPDDTIEISVLPGAHGSADCDILYPDDAGLISEYPGVTADTGYDFTHFVDAVTGDSVDENTVYTADGAIRPVFELKPGWIRVPVPETPGVTFKPENDPEILVDPDGVVQVVPDVKPDEGYKTDGFVDENTGAPVGPGSVIDIDITINITINVYPDGSNPGGGDGTDPDDKTVTVPVLDGEHGTADADSVTTGSDGKIDQFPGTTPDDGYLFDHWENQDGQLVDENTIFENGDLIKPVFKPDPDYKPDLTVTVDVLPGEHGTCTISTITTTSEGKIHTYPDVTPDDGWVLDHWENQDGEPVDENTVWSDGEGARPVYAEDPDCDKTVVVEILPGTNGVCSDDSVTTDGDGKIVDWPDVEPDDGYMFDKWVDEDGNVVDDSTVFVDGDKIRPVFKVIEYIPFTITPSNRTEVGYTGAVDENLVIPETFRGSDGNYYKVVAIGGIAFHQCANLTGVTIPSTVKTIDTAAFSYSGLKSVYIPDSVTTLGRNCFEGCKSMTSIRFSPNAKSIQYMCCAGCKSLTSVTIPYGITTIECAAFQCPRSVWGYTSSLSSLTLPSSLRTIGEAVFSGTSIEVLRVPSSVSSIGYNAFYDMSTIYYSGSASGSPWGAYQVRT